jgi:hypothetical protein
VASAAVPAAVSELQKQQQQQRLLHWQQQHPVRLLHLQRQQPLLLQPAAALLQLPWLHNAAGG